MFSVETEVQEKNNIIYETRSLEISLMLVCSTSPSICSFLRQTLSRSLPLSQISVNKQSICELKEASDPCWSILYAFTAEV
jgi:hypothetical protein